MVGKSKIITICDEKGWETVAFQCWFLLSEIYCLERKKKKKAQSSEVPLAFFSLTRAKVQHILPWVAWDGWDLDGSNILSL